jgi:hypothetical protein
VPDLNSFANQLFDRREAMRPTARTWAKHAAFLAVAFVTVTVAGVLQPFGFIPIFPDANPQTNAEIFQFLLSLPTLYAELILSTVHRLLTDFETLKYGLKFSLCLLAILTAHEAGHYVACRLYGVDATLPYFIPLPPLLGPAGTLGAFIKIISPMPSRRATFDIGVAGPIAGFAAIIPVAIIGLLTMEQAAPSQSTNAQTGLYFSDPLFLQLLGKILGVDSSLGYFNPFLAAGVARAPCYEPEFNSVRAARWRTRDLCRLRRENSSSNRKNRVCCDGGDLRFGLVCLQQPERTFIYDFARRYDAHQAPRTARHRAAQFQSEISRRSDAAYFYLVLCAVSDSSSIMKN